MKLLIASTVLMAAFSFNAIADEFDSLADITLAGKITWTCVVSSDNKRCECTSNDGRLIHHDIYVSAGIKPEEVPEVRKKQCQNWQTALNNQK